jgi:hypothetical protein
LLTGWSLGQIFDNIHLEEVPRPRRYITYISVMLFTISLIGIISSILEIHPLFQGITSEYKNLSSSSIYWIFICITGVGLLNYSIASGIRWQMIINLFTLSCFLILGILTARTSFRAAFINPGNAYEYLVYAHGTDGIKASVSIISQISRRVSGGFSEVPISYDAGGETQGTSWPIKWYMRDFSNSIAFYSVDSSLLNADIIIADPQSFDELDQLLYQNYYQLDTLRIVWPNQDYFDLSDLDLFLAFTEVQGRNALFQIWYEKDYSKYADYYGRGTMSFPNWSPSDQMRIYIKKEIVNQLWEYNTIP